MHHTAIGFCPPEPVVTSDVVSFEPTADAIVLAENHTTVNAKLNDCKEDPCIRVEDMTASWSMSQQKITLSNISFCVTKVSE